MNAKAKTSTSVAAPVRGAAWRDALVWFLTEYAPRHRGLSPRTQDTYATSLRLFHEHLGPEPPAPHEVTATQVLVFLDALERDRGNLPSSRNLRLAALKSFWKGMALWDPAHRGAYERLQDVPSKRATRRSPDYLERDELRGLFELPEARTTAGFRDLTLLRYAYNTGSRISELTGARVDWLSLGEAPEVRIRGKGGKVRTCPLLATTAEMLRIYLRQERGKARPGSEECLFLTRLGRGFTRPGLWKLLHGYFEQAAKAIPSLAHKRLSPHSLRHTVACHLLRAGVDITVIKGWLGHASVSTTSRYLDLDLDKKREALARFLKLDVDRLMGTPGAATAPLPAKLVAWLEHL